MINDENIIIEEIKYFIKSNQIKEQEKLPRERNLSELFTVSRFSLRKALKHLVDTGYLYVKDKSGYYYQGDRIKIQIPHISTIFKKDKSKCRLIVLKKINSDKKISKRLSIENSSSITQAIILYEYIPKCTAIINIFIYTTEAINEENIYDVLTVIIENSSKKGKIYIRDANDFELQLMSIKEHQKICRWISNYEYKENKVYIEQALNILPFEFSGW